MLWISTQSIAVNLYQYISRYIFALSGAGTPLPVNHASPYTNDENDTAIYQQAQKMKRAYALSNVNQVLYKYMDDKNVIKLPNATAGSSTTTPTTPSGGSSGSGRGGSKPGIEG